MSRQISGRSRGNSTGSSGFTYTNHTTTISTVDPSGHMTHVHNSYTRVDGGRSSAREPLRSIREDDDYSDCESCDECAKELDCFSRMRLDDRRDVSRASQSTIRGPRIMEITDGDVDRSMSRYSGSRTSSRPSESHRSSSRITDSRQPSRLISSRPAESHYSSSSSRRPTESRYSSSESRRPTIRASSRPAESHYSSSRPSESRTTVRPGRDLVIYEEPSSQGSRSTKTRSSRRDSGSKMSAMSAIKDVVKRL